MCVLSNIGILKSIVLSILLTPIELTTTNYDLNITELNIKDDNLLLSTETVLVSNTTFDVMNNSTQTENRTGYIACPKTLDASELEIKLYYLVKRIRYPFSGISSAFWIIIALISVFGNLKGEYRWFILNISIMNLFYDLFYEPIDAITDANEWMYTDPVWKNVINVIAATGAGVGRYSALSTLVPMSLSRCLLVYNKNTWHGRLFNKYTMWLWTFGLDCAFFFIVQLMYFLHLEQQQVEMFVFFVYFHAILLSSFFSLLTTRLTIKNYKNMKKLGQKQQMLLALKISCIILFQVFLWFIIFLIVLFTAFTYTYKIFCESLLFIYLPYMFNLSSQIFSMLDSFILLFVFTPYREELFLFFKWLKDFCMRKLNIQVSQLATSWT